MLLIATKTQNRKEHAHIYEHSFFDVIKYFVTRSISVISDQGGKMQNSLKI